MQYNNINELPKNVTNPLPTHAQEIFLAASNNAWEQYDDSSKRQGDDSRETVAMKVAWSAVKQKYVKEDDQWQLK